MGKQTEVMVSSVVSPSKQIISTDKFTPEYECCHLQDPVFSSWMFWRIQPMLLHLHCDIKQVIVTLTPKIKKVKCIVRLKYYLSPCFMEINSFPPWDLHHQCNSLTGHLHYNLFQLLWYGKCPALLLHDPNFLHFPQQMKK